MTKPQEELRQALAAFERERTERALERFRGQDLEPPSAGQRARAMYLAGEQASEALAACQSDGALLPAELRLLASQLADVRHRALLVEAQAGVRSALGGRADTTDERSLARLLHDLGQEPREREARRLASRICRALRDPVRRYGDVQYEARTRVPGRGEPDGPTRALAARVLADSQAAAEECLGALYSPRASARAGAFWYAVWPALRFRELDAHLPVPGRYRRAAASLRLLGFERHLGERVRVEQGPGPLPRAHHLVLAAPADVRIVQAPLAGLQAELLGREGLGRALGLSLHAPGLPWEVRAAGACGPATVLGGLLMSWFADPSYQGAVHGVQGRERERLTRAGALVVLALVRMAATRVLDAAHAGSAGDLLARRAQALSTALCCEVPEELAGLLLSDARGQWVEAEGRLWGVGLHVGLRERFDEDCFRNPRAEEALRELCEPGNVRASSEVVQALGVGVEDVVERLLELLA